MAVLHSRPPPSSLSSISVLQERESKTVAATLERVQTQHRNKARLLRTLTERQAALKKERAQKARPPSSLRFVSAQLAQRKACLKWVAPMLSVAGCHLWSQGEEADQRLEAEHMKWKGLRRETSLLETEALVARATLELESNNLAARLDSEKTMCIRLKTDIEQLETQLQRLKRKQQDNPQLKALQEEQEQRLLDLAKVRHPRHAACLLPPPFECCLWPPTPNVLSRSPGALVGKPRERQAAHTAQGARRNTHRIRSAPGFLATSIPGCSCGGTGASIHAARGHARTKGGTVQGEDRSSIFGCTSVTGPSSPHSNCSCGSVWSHKYTRS